MRKIPTLFVRDEGNRHFVTQEVAPGCHWVVEGLGVATRKWDGTCVRYHEDAWWARREVKPGKTAPEGYVELETDPVTGKTVGWEPAEQSSYAKQLKAAAGDYDWEEGTYELIGPSVNGNPDRQTEDLLMPHGLDPIQVADRSYEGLLALFARLDFIEGLVFYRTEVDPDSGMVKIKRRDFRAAAGVSESPEEIA